MPSAKAKGDKYENDVAKCLKLRGHNIQKAHRTMRLVFTPDKRRIYVSQSNDFWGLFDVISKFGVDSYYIQVKGHVSDVYRCQPSIAEFADKHGNRYDYFQVWLRVPRKGFVVWTWREMNNRKVKNKWYKNYFNLKGQPVEAFPYTG